MSERGAAEVEVGEEHAAFTAWFSILQERRRQDLKWGEQNHDPARWLMILLEEIGEFAKAWLEDGPDSATVSVEAIHVAAVATAMVESLARQGLRAKPDEKGVEQ